MIGSVQRIVEAAQALREALGECDLRGLSGLQALELVEVLCGVEKVCAAARARAAARVEDCGAWRAKGHRSGAQWLAQTMGTRPKQAGELIETAKVMEGLAATSAAFAAGRISEAQAAEVAKAAALDPSAETSLLEVAERCDWRSLKDQARRVRLNAQQDREALHERQHRAREFTHWIDDEGMVAGRFRLPPEVGVPLVNGIDSQTDREYKRAWRQGGREPRAAYSADAFVKLLAQGDGGGPSHTQADLVVVVDLDALRRGYAHDDERCHIPGVGPLPVSVARGVAFDSFLKGVLVDGCEIKKVKHFGRHIAAEVRTALELGRPPELDGARCVEEGCGRRDGLEWDHDDPLAHRGPTAYHNLKARCRPHHRDKTERDRQAGLLLGRDPP